jgi:hypothetical protein
MFLSLLLDFPCTSRAVPIFQGMVLKLSPGFTGKGISYGPLVDWWFEMS